MSENMKKFLEAVSKDKTMQEQFKAINSENKDEVIKETIALAKKCGVALTEADFAAEESGELSEEELAAVTGGSGACACAHYGGGGGTLNPGIDSEYKSWGCGCFGYGQGGNGHDFHNNCYCALIGCGDDNGYSN